MNAFVRYASLFLMILGGCSGTPRVPVDTAVGGEDLASDGAQLDVWEVECVPQCENRECGDDGCGDSCGFCPELLTCDATGLCEFQCEPNCEGRECGNDGCGGSCGECPSVAPVCSADGLCELPCEPQCDGKECGDDGCGFVCGHCGEIGICVGGKCLLGQGSPCEMDAECASGYCVEYNQGKVCTILCAEECPSNWTCVQVQSGPDVTYVCLPKECEPDCSGVSCGDDGCGGSCGGCVDGLVCTLDSCVDGACSHSLDPQWCFIENQCAEGGAQPFAGSCLQCNPALSQDDWSWMPDGIGCPDSMLSYCFEGECCDPLANCTFKECGDNGCGGSCGSCSEQSTCQNGVCVSTCVPACDNVECGDDGCGGSCGECNFQMTCENGSCVSIGNSEQCLALVMCLAECGDSGSCADSCFSSAPLGGQVLYNDFMDCVASQCSQFDDGSMAQQACALEACSTPYGVCVGGYGTDSCYDLISCIGTSCAAPTGDCVWGCLLEGSVAGQTDFWNYQACLGQNCPSCTTQQCWIDCVNGPCVQESSACAN